MISRRPFSLVIVLALAVTAAVLLLDDSATEAATCPTSIAYDETHDCSLSTAGEEDTYAFSGTSGDIVLFRMARAGSGVDPSMRFYRPDESDSGCAATTTGADDEVYCTLDATGTWTIVVSDYGDNETGGYTIHFQRLNPLAGTPTAIAYDDAVSGTISASPEWIDYTFSGTSGDRVLVRMARDGGSVDPKIRLYRPDATDPSQCEASTTGAVAEFYCLLDATGTWMILATDTNGDETGDYGLYLQQLNPLAGTPTAIAYDDAVSGTLSTAWAWDGYEFSGTSGDRVLVRMARDGGSVTPEIRLIRPDGTDPSLCAASTTQGVAEFYCLLDATGTWVLLAGDQGANATGAYGLYLQQLNPLAGTPTAIAYDDTMSGTLGTAWAWDGYEFSGTSGDRILVRMARDGGSVTPEIRLIRPDGTDPSLCAAATTGAEAEFDCLLDATGTWVLLAGDQGANATGAYGLYLQQLNPLAGTPTAIAYDDTVSGTLGTAWEWAEYEFSGSSGDRVKVRMARDGSSITPEIRVYRPDGTDPSQCAAATTGKLAEFDCLLDATGTWVLLAGDQGANATGAFGLYLQRLNPPVGPPTAIAYGDSSPDTISASPEFVEYAFTAAVGQIARVQLTSTSAVDPELRVLRPNGTTKCSAHTVFSSVTVDCAIDVTGVWTILAGDIYGQIESTFTLSLSWGYAAVTEPFDPDHPTSDPGYWTPVSPVEGYEVNLVSGDFAHGNTDVTIPGRGIPLVFRRTYHSGLDYQGALGNGWTHAYEMRLEFDTDEIRVFHPWGHARLFTWNGVDWVPRPGVQEELVENIDDTYTLTTKLQIVYDFDANGRLTAITDRNDNTTTLTYDMGGNLATVEDAGGRTLEFTYDASDRITQIEDPLGRTVDFTYDGSGDLVTVSNLAGEQTTYTYGSNGMLTITDAESHVPVSLTYDGDGRVVELENALGDVTCYDYGTGVSYSSTDCPAVSPAPNSYQTVMVDPEGNKTTYQFDDASRQIKITDALGGVTEFQYNGANNLAKQIDPLDGETTFTYDSRGNVLTRTEEESRTWTYTYDAFNNVLTVTDDLGHATTNTYDTSGNLLTATDAEDGVTTYTVAANGDVTAMTDPRGKVWDYTYDTYGNCTAVENPLADTWTLAYDLGGRLTSVTDPLSHTRSFAYDGMDRLLTATNALTQTVTLTYDDVGNLASVTDANADVTSWDYDAANQLVTITDPDLNAASFAYDANGNRASETNVRGKTTSYTYDALNRLTEIEDPLENTTTFAYDAAGNVTQRVDGRGLVTLYTYDDAHRLTQVQYKDGATVVETVSFTYDSGDRRTQMVDGTGTTAYVYDDANRLTSMTSPGSVTVAYTYDASGLVTQITYPGTETVSYAYDDAGQLTSVTDWNTAATTYTYDAAGRLTETAYPNGVSAAYTYDNADRLLSVTNDNGSTFSSFTYTLDAGGNRTQVVDNAGTTTYTLDDLDRLTAVTVPGPVTTQYTYDALGNRLTRDSLSYTYDDADQLTAVGSMSLSYDGNGNMTARGDDDFAFDHENRLTSATIAGRTWTSTYNGDGLRVARTEDSVTTAFVWDVVAPIPGLLVAGDNRLIHGLDLIATVDDSDTVAYFSYDGLGSVTDLTDDGGSVIGTFTYDEFGNLAGHSGDVLPEWLYTGEQRDGGWSAPSATPLDSVDASTNLTGASVANLDDDPEDPDGDWATATSLDDVELRVGFPTPSGAPLPGADVQAFRVLVRKNAAGGTDPTVDLELWEEGGGSALATLASGVTVDSESGVVVSGAWDADDLVAADGADVEVRVVGHASADRAVEVGAIAWDVVVETEGLYYLRNRHYDPTLGRFVSRDPLRFPQRYAYVGNNPTTFVDPWGLSEFDPYACARAAMEQAGRIGLLPAASLAVGCYLAALGIEAAEEVVALADPFMDFLEENEEIISWTLFAASFVPVLWPAALPWQVYWAFYGAYWAWGEFRAARQSSSWEEFLTRSAWNSVDTALRPVLASAGSSGVQQAASRGGHIGGAFDFAGKFTATTTSGFLGLANLLERK